MVWTVIRVLHSLMQAMMWCVMWQCSWQQYRMGNRWLNCITVRPAYIFTHYLSVSIRFGSTVAVVVLVIVSRLSIVYSKTVIFFIAPYLELILSVIKCHSHSLLATYISLRNCIQNFVSLGRCWWQLDLYVAALVRCMCRTVGGDEAEVLSDSDVLSTAARGRDRQ